MTERALAATGWDAIDAFEIAGDRRGRTVTAHRGSDVFRFRVAFNSDGAVRRFEALA